MDPVYAITTHMVWQNSVGEKAPSHGAERAICYPHPLPCDPPQSFPEPSIST